MRLFALGFSGDTGEGAALFLRRRQLSPAAERFPGFRAGVFLCLITALSWHHISGGFYPLPFSRGPAKSRLKVSGQGNGLRAEAQAHTVYYRIPFLQEATGARAVADLTVDYVSLRNAIRWHSRERSMKNDRVVPVERRARSHSQSGRVWKKKGLILAMAESQRNGVLRLLFRTDLKKIAHNCIICGYLPYLNTEIDLIICMLELLNTACNTFTP